MKPAKSKMKLLQGFAILLCIIPVILGSIPGLDEEDTRDGIRAPKPYYILEELPAKTLIGNVAIDAKLSERYDKSVLSQLRYRFLNQMDDEGDEVDLFEVDERTGIVKTKEQIDRDAICATKVTCLVHLNIGLFPQEYFLEIKIIVDILDVNDNAPRFPEQEIFRRLSESPSDPQQSLVIPTAEDPDSETYSVQKYELVSTSTKFKLTQEKGSDGTVDLRIIPGELDREQVDFYQFKVVAYDGADPPKSGSILVNIEVMDANDNEPKFANSTFEIFVLETVAANTTIGRVEARDIDTDSEIAYGFSDRTKKSYGHLFGIVQATGAIYIKQSLDFELGSSYVLSIYADDGGSHTRPATASVVVRVEDSNDNAPEININTLTQTGVAQVSESANIGTFVAHVSVTDQDGGDNGKVSCTLDHGNFNLQSLDQGQFKVTTAARLNRERDPTFNLQVTCHDMGVQRKTSTSTLYIQVLDSNDHAPEFTMQVYKGDLTENNYEHDQVVKVVATDVDHGINGEVRYKIHSDDDLGLFRIHPTRGQVTANAIFDRESLPEVTFRVVAQDQGSPVQSSTATVVVTILDQNDELPVFLQSQYNFGVFENEKPGSEVGSVQAVDNDNPPYNEFSYRITKSMAGNIVQEAFRIDSKRGKLVTTRFLDRETQPVYYLTIEALSKRGIFPQSSSSASVTIYIADTNDNDPIITWPNQENNTVFISSQTPQFHRVAHIQAHDADIGDNGKLSYHLQPQAETEHLFAINPTTGAISVKTELREIAFEVITLKVVVKDHGFPQRLTQSDLQVVINSTLVYDNDQRVIVTNNNVTIIVSLTSAFLILLFLIIIAIFLFRKTIKEQKGEVFCSQPTSCINRGEPSSRKVRRESQKMLTPREDTPDGREAPVCPIPSSPHRDINLPEREDNILYTYGTWDMKARSCACHHGNQTGDGLEVDIDIGPETSGRELKKSNLKYLQEGSPTNYKDFSKMNPESLRGHCHYNHHEDDDMASPTRHHSNSDFYTNPCSITDHKHKQHPLESMA